MFSTSWVGQHVHLRHSALRAFSSRSSTVQCRAHLVRVSFKCHKSVHYGEALAVVGAGPELGNWNVQHALKLDWHDGDVWVAEQDFPAG